MTNMPMNPMNMMQSMMGNNPLFQIINAVKNGGNPMKLIESMAPNNPMVASAFNMIKGKNPQQLEQLARNMCNEAGVDINQVANRLGFQLPNGK